MTEPVPARLLWFVAGFVVWTSAFLAIYGLQALGCAYGWPRPVHRLVLFAVLGAHLAAIALMIWRSRDRPEARFVDKVAFYTLWAALVATVLTYGPALVLTACE